MSKPRFQIVPGNRMHASSACAGWRLLGSNNRELGRGVAVYDSVDFATEAVATIRWAIAGLRFEHERDDTGLWRWAGYLGADEVAHSGRGFRREQDCRTNEEQFIACCADASVTFAEATAGEHSVDITV